MINSSYKKGNNQFLLNIDDLSVDDKFLFGNPKVLMIDSGTSFTHFPYKLYSEVLGWLKTNKTLRNLFDSSDSCISKDSFKD